MSFEGQTIVVTGGTRGLGKAIALDFLERGARLFVTYHKSEEAAEGIASFREKRKPSWAVDATEET